MNCVLCGKETDALRDDICLDCHGRLFIQDFLETAPLAKDMRVKLLVAGQWSGKWAIVGEDFSGGWDEWVLVNVPRGEDGLYQWEKRRRNTLSKL